ncbi:MAG: dTDP-4-dehydrorhamnose 3,5-epimerase family protein [Solirubrobacterales bacterium]|nr:dTDP-4-dehydrorhamnose 3,5-epimerase family protein [Solirubrobacterales bacterium]
MNPARRMDGAAMISGRRLTPHRDDRGVFTELFRDEWALGVEAERWDLLCLQDGACRTVGSAVLVALDGRAELRADGQLTTLEADVPHAVTIAAGEHAELRACAGGALIARGQPAGVGPLPMLPPAWDGPELPPGVELVNLPMDPGSLELHDRRRDPPVRPVQWNAVRSRTGVLRGVHCHGRHADLLCVVRGAMQLGLADLRAGTDHRPLCVEMSGDRPQMVAIPPGVAHGFLFLEDSLHVYAVDHTWDPADEAGCRWDDPVLAMPWGLQPERVSSRDLGLGTLAELREALTG